MKRNKLFDSDERGATLVEFAIALTVFLTSMFAVWNLDARCGYTTRLTDAARRGARYAALHSSC